MLRSCTNKSSSSIYKRIHFLWHQLPVKYPCIGNMPLVHWKVDSYTNAPDVTFQCTRGIFPMHSCNFSNAQSEFPMHATKKSCFSVACLLSPQAHQYIGSSRSLLLLLRL